MKKLGRKRDYRILLHKNLVTSIILYEKIQTTLSKAKSVVGIVDKMITVAKKNDLNSRRFLLGYLKDKNAVKKMFEEIVPRYKNRNSGYTRIFKIGKRVGDGADKALIELIPIENEKSEESSKDKKDKVNK